MFDSVLTRATQQRVGCLLSESCSLPAPLLSDWMHTLPIHTAYNPASPSQFGATLSGRGM